MKEPNKTRLRSFGREYRGETMKQLPVFQYNDLIGLGIILWTWTTQLDWDLS